MTSKFSIDNRELLQRISSGEAVVGIDFGNLIVRELAAFRLAAMDSEPVAYTDERNLGYIDRGRETAYLWGKQNSEASDVALYRHAQPAPERDQVRIAHAEWSQATFGNVGPVGPLKHLSKEALEAAAEPGDLSEWADMQFLLWDAQRRAGITDEQITHAMIEKLAVNKQREWPEPKDGEPRLHIKEQPAPVVPDERDKAVDADDHPLLWSFNEGWNACRSAMLAAAPQLPGSEPATVPGKWIPVSELMPEVGVKVLCFPVKDEPIHATFNGQLWLQDISWSGSEEPIDNVIPVTVTHWMPLPAGPQEVR
ncbi:TPA: dATP/dGTP pyrophosphohydrolase domain-containing protein [Klebsiella pneumoniae]